MSDQDLSVESLLASLSGEDLMSKQASSNEPSTSETIQKQASDTTSTKDTYMSDVSLAGQMLAAQLLEKFANEGEVNTGNGLSAQATPTTVALNNAQMVNEQSLVTNKPNPGTVDGNSGGTVNQIFDAVIADAMGQGAATYDNLQNTLSTADNTSGVVADDEVEKTAAVWTLVQTGVDFDSAVTLVKQAEQELIEEENQQVKQAALDTLMQQGIDFNTAVAMIKQAGIRESLANLGAKVNEGIGRGAEKLRNWANTGATSLKDRVAAGVERVGDAANNAKQSIIDNAQQLGTDFSQAVSSSYPSAVRVDSAKNVVTNPLVYGPAGAAAAGGLAAAGVMGAKMLRNKHNATQAAQALANRSIGQKAMDFARSHPYALAGGAGLGLGGAALIANEKRAAVSNLVSCGVDFDTATDLVAAKSYELYGF